MSTILKFDFQRKKTITFFWSKLSKIHKKDPILHVATTFSLKQGETRTKCVTIPHLLRIEMVMHKDTQKMQLQRYKQSIITQQIKLQQFHWLIGKKNISVLHKISEF